MYVRSPEHLDEVSGIIVPGGESTTIGMLMERFGLLEAIRSRALEGMPVLGTCAGAILLAKDIENSSQPRLGLMDMTVRRNAYGRQVDSFEADIVAPELGNGAVRGVFIRAPVIMSVAANVEVLARFEEMPVIVRQNNLMAITFHPELTGDTRLHERFVEMARS